MIAYMLVLAAACELFSAINYKREMQILESSRVYLKAGIGPKMLPDGFWGAWLRNTISMISLCAALVVHPSVVFFYVLPICFLALSQTFFQHKRYAGLFVVDYSISAVCFFLAALAIRNI